MNILLYKIQRAVKQIVLNYNIKNINFHSVEIVL